MSLGTRVLNGQPAITSTRVGTTHADRDHPETARVGRWESVRSSSRRERVLLEHDWWMMPDPGFQKPMPYLAETVRRNS